MRLLYEDGNAKEGIRVHERERLTDAELKIMHVLWARAPSTMPEITKALAAETGWTRHTVIGLLKRMIEKGTVRVEEGEGLKRYHPLVQREAVQREQTDALVGRLFGGDVLKMVSNIVDGGALDDAELDALSRMLDEARRREKGEGPGR